MSGAERIAVIGETPEIVVGHPAGRPVPLGLDRALPLLGGGSIGPDGLPLAAGLDHLPDLRNFVATACYAQARAGRRWYHHPPVALIGGEGSGRGLASRWIAREAGVPVFQVDAKAFEPEAEAYEPCVPLPEIPAMAMAAARCANPILHVTMPDDGLSTAGERRLAELADPARAGRRHVPGMSVILDYGHVSWVFQGRHVPAALAEVLDFTGGLIAVPPPYGENGRLLAIAATREACLGRTGGRALAEAVLDEVTAGIRHPATAAAFCAAAQKAADRLEHSFP